MTWLCQTRLSLAIAAVPVTVAVLMKIFCFVKILFVNFPSSSLGQEIGTA